MSEKNSGRTKSQPSTSANLEPDPEHGGLARFQDVDAAELFRKETQARERKLQDPAIRATCRLQSAAGVTGLHKPDGPVMMFKDWDAVDGYKKKFWIKFSCREDQLKIEKYYMPPGFDRRELEAEYTDGSLSNKQFLNDCKTWMERFTYRKQQFKKLEDFLKSSDLYCAIPHADPSYKTFSIRLERNVDDRFVQPSLVVVKICYSQNLTKPMKTVIESAGALELAESERDTLNNIFKILKLVELEEALEQIFNSSDSQGIWKREIPILEERFTKNNRSRRSQESLESEDSFSRRRRNEETLESNGDERFRSSENSSDDSDWEAQNKKATASRKRRGKSKAVKKVAAPGSKRKKTLMIREENSRDENNVKSTDEPESLSRNSPQKKTPIEPSSSKQLKNKISNMKKQKASSGGKKKSRAISPVKKKH